MIQMSKESRQNLETMEKNSRFPTGILTIERGECPLGGMNPMACTFCSYGHMLECHYPHTYEEVQCSHWQREQENPE